MIKYNKVKRRGEVKTWVCVVEGYRPGPGLPPRQRTIKSFGYLEEQADRQAFMREVEEFNARCKDDTQLRVEVASSAVMYAKENRRQNYGYLFLQAVYGKLGIGEFVERHERAHRRKGNCATAEILRFLVLSRILYPGSKRANSQRRDNFYGMKAKFTLQDIYRALDRIAELEVGLQRHLNEAVKGFIGRDLTHAFYDVTNYFFEVDFPDKEGELRQRGVSKEHRVTPIAGMGLFMDSSGIPICMSIFPGNQAESTTLSPVMREVKESYGIGRLVIVADKGLNSSGNIDRIVNGGDGYVVSQTLRGAKGKRYHDKLFDDNGYVEDAAGAYRYKLFEEEYEGKDAGGEKVTRKRQVLIYWSRAAATRARRQREEKLRKAERAIRNNVYGVKKGVDEYVRENVVVRETGELLASSGIRKVKTLDVAKAEGDARFDGYFCILTSEPGYDAGRIRAAYGGLWRIEESFRILKSDLYARPVYVWTQAHIRAHFLICFVALLLVRLLQHRMGTGALSTERLTAALSAATCRVLKGGVIQLDDVGGQLAFRKARNAKGELVDTLDFSDDDQIALDYQRIQTAFGTSFYNIYPRQEVFNRFLKNIAVS